MIAKEFQENIESGNIIAVRSALLDDLIIDRTFKTFEEEYKAASKKINLLVPYDGEPFETDPKKWDMEYLNLQKVELMMNFSEERIAHLQKVIAKIMPPTVEKNSNIPTTVESYSKNKLTGRRITKKTTKIIPAEKNNADKKKENEKNTFGNALIIGGIATTTAGIALAQPVVVGTGVIATGAGVCIKVYNRR